MSAGLLILRFCCLYYGSVRKTVVDYQLPIEAMLFPLVQMPRLLLQTHLNYLYIKDKIVYSYYMGSSCIL